jgi:rod shape-determining protein MreD
MKKHPILTIITLTIFLAVLQTAFFDFLFGPRLNAHLVMVLVVGLLLSNSRDSAHLCALVGGVLLEIFYGKTMGISALAMSLFVILYSTLENFYLRNVLLKLLVAFLFIYLLKLLQFGVVKFDSYILLSALLTTLLAFALSLFIKGTTNEQKINL